MKIPKVIPIIQKIALEMEAELLIEPEFNYTGYITFKNGKKTIFYNNIFDINEVASSKIAKDKGYTTFFLNELGYKVPKSQTFFSDDFGKIIGSSRKIDEGYEYAKTIGFPVVVKPNDGSRGELVSKVYNKKQYYQAAKKIFKNYRVMIAQEFCMGSDYRIVVLDDKVVAVYKRIPLFIEGDGQSSVLQLIEQKQEQLFKYNRNIKIDINDYRIKNNFNKYKLTLNSIVPNNEKVFIMDNANLSTGGDAVDFTNTIHEDFVKLAISITKDMGLRLCGVDIITSDITLPIEESDYAVIEINSSPGLSNFASLGEEQYKIAENIYRQILMKIENI